MKTRVLIVEDDLALKPLWEFILLRQFNDFHLDWAVSAEEANKMVSCSIKFDSPYTLIITDFFLTGLGTGVDVVRYVGRGVRGSPVILMSEVDEKMLRATYGELLEEMLVLTKPLSVSKCELALDKIFGVATDPFIKLVRN